jgi:hypothetical protein
MKILPKIQFTFFACIFKIGLLSFIVFLWSCRKDTSNTQQTFKGTVRDYSSRNGINPIPISDAQVQLIKADGITGSSPTITLINPEYFYTTSDANGNFQFTESIDSKNVFALRESKEEYIFIDLHNEKELPSTNTIYTDILYLDKTSIVKIIFHDTLSTSLNDSLFLMTEYSSNPSTFGADINTFINHSNIISHNQTISFTDSISGSTFANAELTWSVRDSNNVGTLGNHYYPVNQFGITTIEIFF